MAALEAERSALRSASLALAEDLAAAERAALGRAASAEALARALAGDNARLRGALRDVVSSEQEQRAERGGVVEQGEQ